MNISRRSLLVQRQSQTAGLCLHFPRGPQRNFRNIHSRNLGLSCRNGMHRTDGNPFKNIPVLPQKVVLFPATNIIHSFGLNFYVNGQDILGICTISSCFSWKFFGILLTSIVSIFPKITNIDTKSTYAPCRGINLFKYLMHFFKYFQIFRNLPGFYFE